jgi:hypothetical protein
VPEADETLSDTLLEKTQELDAAAFDATVKDVKDQDQIDTAPIPALAVAEAVKEPPGEQTLDVPPPARPDPSLTLGMTAGKKLLLLVVVLIAAAGAWLYWAH